MNELEFKTFRVISKPGKKIPGISDEELIFLLSYYIFAIIGMMIFLGFIPSMFKIQIPAIFINTFTKVFFGLVPVVSFIIIKTAGIGKQEGYIFQKVYMWFQSSLLNEIDTRNKKDREELKRLNNKWLGFLKNPNTFKKSHNPQLHNYSLKFDLELEKEKIKNDYLNALKMYENYISTKNSKIKEQKEEYFKNVESSFNYWYSYYKKLNKRNI